jgi:hypothetical protein
MDWRAADATTFVGRQAEIGAEAVSRARELGDDELLSLASYGEGIPVGGCIRPMPPGR